MKKMAAIFLGLRALVFAALVGAPIAHGQELSSTDDAAWAAAADAGTPEAYQHYLEEFPAGRHVEEAFRLLIEGRLESVPDAAKGFDIY